MSEVVRTNLSPMDYLSEKQRNTWNIQNEDLMSNPFTEWFKREKERRKIERIKNKN